MSQSLSDRGPASHRPLAVAVLFGGWSSEREVSLASGRAVIDALRSRDHDVREVDPAVFDVPSYPWAGIDAAFIALHGAFGEDGTIQSLLDDMRIPYTGSGPDSCRIAMNKSAAKQRFTALGLLTPAYQTAHVQDSGDSISQKAREIGFPLVVKPNSQGSSIGVSIVTNPDDLEMATQGAFQFDPWIVLERYIPGRELTVAVLERQALPILEIRPARPFYDYRAKYFDDATNYLFDTGLPREVEHAIESLALSAAESLGTSGVARVDLRLDNELRPWLLEVNTIPGFTDHSLVPKAAARLGISLAELCETLILSKMRSHTAVGSRAA